MSLAEVKIKQETCLNDIYNALEEQEATIPTQKNLVNVAPAIKSISGGTTGLIAIYISVIGGTQYREGETFSLNGYTINAVYGDGSQKDVTSTCTFSPSGALPTGDSIVTISYLENGIEKTVTQAVTCANTQLINYLMLYDNGDECIDVTGGWTQYASNGGSYFTGKAGQITKNTNNLQVSSIPNKALRSLFTANQINYREYKGVSVKYNQINGDGLAMVSLPTTITGSYGSGPNTDRYSYYKQISTGNIYNELSVMNFSDFSFAAGYQMSESTIPYAGLLLQSTSSSGSSINIQFFNVLFFKEDNWTELCSIAGLNSSSYTSELALCNNSTAISTILNNEEAVKYMIYKCTGSFMNYFMVSETALTALNNSSYKNLIQANEVWSKFLSMVA